MRLQVPVCPKGVPLDDSEFYKAMSKIVEFGPKLKELRIILCQASEASNGVRTFISEHYMDLKDKNPKLPILVRECSGVVPKIYARFEKGREVNVNVSNLSSAEILRRLNGMNLLDIRIHYCPRNYVSRGTREFIDIFLPDVRKSNPGFPVFLIPYYGVEPWLYARYKYGRKSKIRLSDLTANQVLCVVEEVSNGGFWMGSYLQKPTTAPRGLQLLPKEIKSRNPFEILSKLQ